MFQSQLDANLVYVDATDRFLELLDGVKAHHNVGGLPDDLQFELCEPVKLLYKDKVRVIGRELGLPEGMVERGELRHAAHPQSNAVHRLPEKLTIWSKLDYRNLADRSNKRLE